MFCINKNSEEFKSLVEQVGFKDAVAYYLAKGYVDTEDTGFTPTTETSTGIKPGVEELFESNQSLTNSLFGLSTENQKQLEFHVNTLNVVSKFLENVGVETRFVPEFLTQNGSVVQGAIAAANFIEGTVDIIDEIEKGRADAWNKLPEEAAHFWYRLLDKNKPLKKLLWEAHQTEQKAIELKTSQYGNTYEEFDTLKEEAIGQLIAQSIKRLETKNGNPADYSFVKKFLEWVRKTIEIFKKSISNLDPFEVAAMKILSSDMSDLMTWEEYRKLNNIVNFADVLTEQSVAPIDYTLLTDVGELDFSTIYDVDSGENIVVYAFANSPWFNSKEELDVWVYNNYGEQLDKKQKQILQEVIDNQVFFDRLLNKTFRKKSRFLSKTLRKYFDIIDAQNLNPLSEWNISTELQKITKKLSEQEKEQIIATNGYTNITPTLKVLPDVLQKYRKNPIVLSEPIKIDGAKKQELSILNGIKEMIKLENPNLKSITSEEFVNEVHNWLQTNYLLGFANENRFMSYRTDQTFEYLSDRKTIEDVDINNLTEEEIQRLPFEERQRIANIIGLSKQNPDIYHNKISLRFNDMYHLRYGHFDKAPSAWGNLTYFYTGKNKWKDAVLLHEIQNDNIEFLRDFKAEEVNLETSLGKYLQQLNTELLDNITQIESGGQKVIRKNKLESNPPRHHLQLNYQLNQIKDLPFDQGLQQLKEKLNEQIELFKSNNSTRTNVELAQKYLEKAYSKRRIFKDFQNRGGIKSLLTKEELSSLEEILISLNNELVYESGFYLPEENVYEAGYERFRELSEKKEVFKDRVAALQKEINKKLNDLYGDNAPFIMLQAPAKARTKLQIRQGFSSSQKLNENVNFLIAYNEKKILTNLSKRIEIAKVDFIAARKATIANNFNTALSKITPKQYSVLIENYKYNENLLDKLINEQIQKDIKKENNAQEKINKALQTIENRDYYYEYFLDDQIFSADSREIAEQEIKDYYNPEAQKAKQNRNFEKLKQKALDKKAELEKNYGKIEEEVKQTLEIEMNYFTPLVHHLIQKHINQYGKDFPMYFSGYQITKLTQGNKRTALIYAGKDEVNTVNKNVFTFNNDVYEIKDVSEAGPIVFGYFRNKLRINQQEYEKAYQQATERKAKEIKVRVAQKLGLLDSKYTESLNKIGIEETISQMTEKELDEQLKKLNDYKKKSKENMDAVILGIMDISNSEPIETGAIYNAMSQISGVKLIWQDKIDGLKNKAGGYLVDLSNYNYNTPILYGLSQKPQENKVDDNGRLLIGEERKTVAKMLGLTKSKVSNKKRFEVIKFVDYYNKTNTEGRKFYVPFKLVQKGYGTDEFTWEIYDYGTGQMSMDFNRPAVDDKEETSPVVEELMTYDQIAKQREFEDLVKKARLNEEIGINMFGDSFGPEKISLQEGYINPETEPVLYKNYVNKYNLQNNSNITGYEFLKDTEDEVFDMSSFYNFLQEEGFVGIDLSYYDLSTVNFDDYNQDVRKNDNFNNGIDPIAGFPVPPSC